MPLTTDFAFFGRQQATADRGSGPVSAMTFDDLHDRLDALSQQLDEKRAEFNTRDQRHDGHALTAGELLIRHQYLVDALEAQVASLEAHHQSISALERDMHVWINSFDLVVP